MPEEYMTVGKLIEEEDERERKEEELDALDFEFRIKNIRTLAELWLAS